jgi:hypothetical protein
MDYVFPPLQIFNVIKYLLVYNIYLPTFLDYYYYYYYYYYLYECKMVDFVRHQLKEKH